MASSKASSTSSFYHFFPNHQSKMPRRFKLRKVVRIVSNLISCTGSPSKPLKIIQEDDHNMRRSKLKERLRRKLISKFAGQQSAFRPTLVLESDSNHSIGESRPTVETIAESSTEEASNSTSSTDATVKSIPAANISSTPNVNSTHSSHATVSSLTTPQAVNGASYTNSAVARVSFTPSATNSSTHNVSSITHSAATNTCTTVVSSTHSSAAMPSTNVTTELDSSINCIQQITSLSIRNKDRKISLEYCLYENESNQFRGCLQVSKSIIMSQVFVRYTLDEWSTQEDTPAEQQEGSNTYIFQLPCHNPGNTEFALCVLSEDGGEWWDNNEYQNYTVGLNSKPSINTPHTIDNTVSDHSTPEITPSSSVETELIAKDVLCDGVLKSLVHQMISLEYCVYEFGNFHGIVHVSEAVQVKRVFVRYSMDGWDSYHDTEAYSLYHKGQSGVYSFCLPCQNPGTTKFALCVESIDGRAWWDNNKESNYTVELSSQPTFIPRKPGQYAIATEQTAMSLLSCTSIASDSAEDSPASESATTVTIGCNTWQLDTEETNVQLHHRGDTSDMTISNDCIPETIPKEETRRSLSEVTNAIAKDANCEEDKVNNRVVEHMISLEYCYHQSDSFRGIIRVSEAVQVKRVFVRYSMDGWDSHQDTEAYLLYHKGQTGTYGFCLPCQNPDTTKFALCVETINKRAWWDNNRGNRWISADINLKDVLAAEQTAQAAGYAQTASTLVTDVQCVTEKSTFAHQITSEDSSESLCCPLPPDILQTNTSGSLVECTHEVAISNSVNWLGASCEGSNAEFEDEFNTSTAIKMQSLKLSHEGKVRISGQILESLQLLSEEALGAADNILKSLQLMSLEGIVDNKEQVLHVSSSGGTCLDRKTAISDGVLTVIGELATLTGITVTELVGNLQTCTNSKKMLTSTSLPTLSRKEPIMHICKPQHCLQQEQLQLEPMEHPEPSVTESIQETSSGASPNQGPFYIVKDGKFPSPSIFQFDQPQHSEGDLALRVQRLKISLEYCMCGSTNEFSGFVRVSDSVTVKHVFARYTCDEWVSHTDVPANLNAKNYREEQSDRYVFDMPFCNSGYTDFCLCVESVDGEVWWDNNFGKNYRVGLNYK